MTSRQEIVQRARELVPRLQEQAGQTEKLRQPLASTVKALCDAELIRAAQPVRFGGLGLDFDVVFEVAAELGRGCGSTAWCYSVWASHNWLLGMFPEQAQEEYWAASPDTLSSTSFNPSRGTAEATSGGYLVSGHWDFSSGCDAASWALVIANGPAGPLMLLLPRADYQIQDNWFVSGLRGTGSKDLLIDNAFVPEHRSLPVEDMREARTPGRRLHPTANYQIPLRSILSFTLAAPVVGMAQGMLEAFESRTRQGVAPRGGWKLAEVPSLQLRLGEAAAEVWAARAIMRQDAQEIFQRARCGEMPTLEDRARYRRDQGYIARLCVQAANRLFEASGGHALYDSSPLQRFHRDIHAASHHFSLTWDPVAQQYGKIRLGLEPDSPDL